MSPDELKAIEALRAATVKIKLDGFAEMQLLAEMRPEQLLAAGYRGGPAEAVLLALRSRIKEVDKLLAAHVKKYPD